MTDRQPLLIVTVVIELESPKKRQYWGLWIYISRMALAKNRIPTVYKIIDILLLLKTYHPALKFSIHS